jgi:hypothetical protein
MCGRNMDKRMMSNVEVAEWLTVASRAVGEAARATDVEAVKAGLAEASNAILCAYAGLKGEVHLCGPPLYELQLQFEALAREHAGKQTFN